MIRLVILVSIVAFLGLVAADMDVQFRQTMEECLRKNNLDPDELRARYKAEGRPKSPDELPEPILCAKKCVNEKFEVLGPDGVLDKSKIKFLEQLPDDVEAVVKECLDNVGKIANCMDMKRVEACLWDHRSKKWENRN